MLDSDVRPAAALAATPFEGSGASLYWDGKQLLGREVSRSIGEPVEVAWDIYLFYEPGDQWTDAGLPPPRAALAQVGIGDGPGVVATPKGLLPPKGDQSLVPQFLAPRVDLVGTSGELAALLQRIARTQLGIHTP